MLEQGRCAKGSSSAFCGASTLGLVAISSPPKKRLFVRLGCWRAGLADRLDTANLKYRACASRARYPSDSHLLAHVFGESFSRKAFRLQIGHRTQIPIVD